MLNAALIAERTQIVLGRRKQAVSCCMAVTARTTLLQVPPRGCNTARRSLCEVANFECNLQFISCCATLPALQRSGENFWLPPLPSSGVRSACRGSGCNTHWWSCSYAPMLLRSYKTSFSQSTVTLVQVLRPTLAPLWEETHDQRWQ